MVRAPLPLQGAHVISPKACLGSIHIITLDDSSARMYVPLSPVLQFLALKQYCELPVMRLRTRDENSMAKILSGS